MIHRKIYIDKHQVTLIKVVIVSRRRVRYRNKMYMANTKTVKMKFEGGASAVGLPVEPLHSEDENSF